MNAVAPNWLGKATPIFESEIAQLYWLTDIPTVEIIEAFNLDCHPNAVKKHVGPARIQIKCEACSELFVVTSRSKALEAFYDAKRRRHRKSECARCTDKRVAEHNAPYEAAYRRRQERFAELQRMPYGEYLQTQEWQETRQAALKRARYSCQTCSGGGTLHVHHRTYARRGREHSTDLTVLCAGCHDLFHKNARLAEGGRASLTNPHSSLTPSGATTAGEAPTSLMASPATIQARPS